MKTQTNWRNGHQIVGEALQLQIQDARLCMSEDKQSMSMDILAAAAASRIDQPEMSRISCPATWARGRKRASYGDYDTENDLAGGVAAREVMTKDIGLVQGSLPWRHVW